MFKSQTLQTKITLLVIAIVAVVVFTMVAFFADWTVDNVGDKVENNVLNIARIVAHSEVVRSQLEQGDPDKVIRTFVDEILQSVDHVQFIVVADMNAVRYSHPNPQQIDQVFMGGDQERVLEVGDTYVSEATGTLGKSLRAFTPIYSLEGDRQIGFVSVGTLTSSIKEAQREAFINIVVIAAIALILGSFGALVLAINIKKTLLGLEPDEIVHLYTDKSAMLEAIDEGIIAVDSKGLITMINESALSILQIPANQKAGFYIGKDINEIFPTTRLPQILLDGKAEFDTEQRIEDTLIVTNRVPIIEQGKIIGAVATFRDKTRVMMLAEEVTGVRQIVDALRANTHEFMNKLHVLLGLIQMEAYDEAKSFIIAVREKQEQIISQIMNQIQDVTVAGLVLGKMNRAKELGVIFKVDTGTRVYFDHGIITSDVLVTIVGNLLENAMEAAAVQTSEQREVTLLMIENDESISVDVRDSGIGIPESDKALIFTRGYSTKEGSRGVGLATVKSNVEAFQGQLEVTSQVGAGSRVTAVLYKELKHDQSIDC